MTETTKQDYAAKIKTTGGVIGMLRNTANGEVGDILGRYKGQVALKDRGEAYAVRQHIREYHSLDSPNGCPPELRKGTASLVHDLIHAFDDEDTTDIEDEPPLQDSPNSITPEDAERMSRESLEVELICDAEELGDIDGIPSDPDPINEFGVSGLVLQAAGFALNRGALTQDQYRDVCRGEASLDDARNDFEALPEIEKADAKPKKKANGNGSKKSKKRAKAEPKEPKPRATWRIVALLDNGVEEILHEAITRKDLLLDAGAVNTGKSRKVLATRRGVPVKMTHSVSGKEYVSKPNTK